MVGDSSFSYPGQGLSTAAELALPIKTLASRSGGYKVLSDYHEIVSVHPGELPSMGIGHLDSARVAHGYGVARRGVGCVRKLEDAVPWPDGAAWPALPEI